MGLSASQRPPEPAMVWVTGQCYVGSYRADISGFATHDCLW